MSSPRKRYNPSSKRSRASGSAISALSDGETRLQAALYLGRLNDARTFTRYAERAFREAIKLAPDEQAMKEAEELRVLAVQLRCRIQEYHNQGNGRFNPKRTVRRVVIEDGTK